LSPPAFGAVPDQLAGLLQFPSGTPPPFQTSVVAARNEGAARNNDPTAAARRKKPIFVCVIKGFIFIFYIKFTVLIYTI
jgi:hypothetical protein